MHAILLRKTPIMHLHACKQDRYMDCSICLTAALKSGKNKKNVSCPRIFYKLILGQKL